MPSRGARTAALVLCGCLGAAALTGCSASSNDSNGPAAASEPGVARSETSGGARSADGFAPEAPGGPKNTVPGSKSQARVPVTTRSLVITSSRTVRVDAVTTAEDKVRDIARAHGGEVSGEDSSMADARQGAAGARSTLVLRVPNAAVDAVEADVDALGERLSASRSTVDVTQDVVDVDSRVANAKRSIARVQVLLDRATSISDVVRIEGELASREADLDSLTARQRTLAGTTAMATVNVTLVGKAVAVAAAKHQRGFSGGLHSGWRAFTESVSTTLLIVGALLPFLLAALVLALVVAAVLRGVRSLRGQRAGRPRDAALLP